MLDAAGPLIIRAAEAPASFVLLIRQESLHGEVIIVRCRQLVLRKLLLRAGVAVEVVFGLCLVSCCLGGRFVLLYVL